MKYCSLALDGVGTDELYHLNIRDEERTEWSSPKVPETYRNLLSLEQDRKFPPVLLNSMGPLLDPSDYRTDYTKN